MIDKILRSKTWWLALLAVAVVFIYTSSLFSFRLDLTAEKRFTVSQPVRQMLQQLNGNVHIDVLLEGDDLPSGFKKLANTARDFLDNCKSYSRGKLTYNFVEPEDFLTDSIRFPFDAEYKTAWLKENGVKQNSVTKNATVAVFNYPVAIVTYNGESAPVNLLKGQGNKGFLNPDAADVQAEVINNAEAMLEYQFASAVWDLTRTTVPMIGYLTGNGEPTGANTYDLYTTLKSKYRFGMVDIKKNDHIPDSIRALIIAKPTETFSEAEKLKIDQYIMRGGNVLFLIDELNADMDSLRSSGKDLTAFDRNLQLDDLLFRYGVRVNQNLVQDKQCDVLPQVVGMNGDQPQMEMLPWPYFPLLYNISNHPVAKNLDAVVMQFPNSIDTVKADGIKKEILLRTSNTSRITGAPVIVSVEALKELENASAYKQAGVPVAVLLEGNFRSLFANRLTPQQQDSLGRPFIQTGNKAARILVTGDGDWVTNTPTKQGPGEMGENPYTQYRFANKEFFLNTLEYMTDETGILASRSKEYNLRLLDPKKLETSKATWQLINTGLPVLLIVLAGAVFNWRRKQKFAA